MDIDVKELSDIWIGTAALNGLLMVVNGGTFLAAVFLCRRKSDGARNVVRWLKISLFFFGIFTFLFTIYAALVAALYRDHSFSFKVLDVFGTLAYTSQIIVKTLVFATLSSLARGILQAREGKRPKLGLSVAFVTYALTAVNIILAIVWLGVRLYALLGPVSSFSKLHLHSNRLLAVPMIFLFVASLVALGNSAVVLINVKSKSPTLKTAAIYNIATTFLFFVSSIYEIIDIGLHIPLSLTSIPKEPPNAITIIMFFFSTAPAFLALALIFNLTRTKDKGLWTITATAPPGGTFAPAPQPGFQGQPPMMQPQPGFQSGFGQAPQQPGVYYPPPQPQQQFPPGTAPMYQPVPQPAPQPGFAPYPMGQTQSPPTVPSPPQGQAQPHDTTT